MNILIVIYSHAFRSVKRGAGEITLDFPALCTRMGDGRNVVAWIRLM